MEEYFDLDRFIDEFTSSGREEAEPEEPNNPDD